MAQHKGERSLMPDLTTMAGVALIIVLMMMMTAQQLLTSEDTPVEVPPAQTMERNTEENLTIAFRVNEVGAKEYYLNDSLMSLEYIEQRVANKMGEDQYFLVVVRADKSSPSQWVLDLLRMVKKAGAQRVAVSTKRIKGKKSATEEKES